MWHSEEAGELAAVLAAYAEPGREGVLRYALATRLLGRDAAQIARCQDDERAWDEERAAAEQYHQLWQQHGFMRVFRAWLDQERGPERLLAGLDGERRLTNLLHLAELLQAESLQRPGLEALLAWFEGQRGSEGLGEDALLRLESDAERVQIVTIHTSKGLEYPLVFCPFLWDGRLLGQHTDSARCHDEDGQPLLDLGSERRFVRSAGCALLLDGKGDMECSFHIRHFHLEAGRIAQRDRDAVNLTFVFDVGKDDIASESVIFIVN